MPSATVCRCVRDPACARECVTFIPSECVKHVLADCQARTLDPVYAASNGSPDSAAQEHTLRNFPSLFLCLFHLLPSRSCFAFHSFVYEEEVTCVCYGGVGGSAHG